MNSSEQAKNGFKTFVITLSISLILFSVVYYVLTDAGTKVSIESEDQVRVSSKETKAVVAGAKTETATVFSELNEQKSNVPAQKVVLGAADETTQSTVPATGIMTTTYAFVMSMSAVIVGAYFLIQSRRKALLNFEKDIRENLK